MGTAVGARCVATDESIEVNKMKKMNLAIGAFVLIVAAALLVPAAMAAPSAPAATGICDGDQDMLQNRTMDQDRLKDGSCANNVAVSEDPTSVRSQDKTRICSGDGQGTMTQMRTQMGQMTGEGQGQMLQNKGMHCAGQ
jgi:hypothetical protein